MLAGVVHTRLVFVTLSSTQSFEPMSAAAATYVRDVAPSIGVQSLSSVAEHRSHCQLTAGTGPPDHSALAVSVCPSCGVPEIAISGSTVTTASSACAEARAGSSAQRSTVAAAIVRSGRVVTDRHRIRQAHLSNGRERDQYRVLAERSGG